MHRSRSSDRQNKHAKTEVRDTKVKKEETHSQLLCKLILSYYTFNLVHMLL